MQLRKIKVYGKLRKFLGQSTFEAAVNSPQQAFNFLSANFEGIEKHMNNQVYKVKVGGRVVSQEFLNMKGQGEIQIIPVAIGAEFVANFVEDAIGFAGDVVNFVFDNALTLGAAALTGGWSYVATVAALTVASDLLSPDQPVQNASAVGDIDPGIRGSYSFSGIQNVSSSGIPIPIIYGRVFSGSIIISAGTDTTQIIGMLSSTLTYTQSGNLITVTANGHNFKNGENINVNFTSGPLNGSNVDNATFGVQNVTTNTFKMSTGVWNSQTYSNSGNELEVTARNLP
tara:strand:- start:2518 stop:3372 length:855 start_codon:yes stop_codon:yes gene_type:complete